MSVPRSEVVQYHVHEKPLLPFSTVECCRSDVAVHRHKILGNSMPNLQSKPRSTGKIKIIFPGGQLFAHLSSGAVKNIVSQIQRHKSSMCSHPLKSKDVRHLVKSMLQIFLFLSILIKRCQTSYDFPYFLRINHRTYRRFILSTNPSVPLCGPCTIPRDRLVRSIS